MKLEIIPRSAPAKTGDKTGDECREFDVMTGPQIREQFGLLDSIIQRWAMQIGDDVGITRSHWQELLPHLSRMQSLLSQRGAHSLKPRLISWTDYVKNLHAKIGLRSIQRQLAEFRCLLPKELKKKVACLELTKRQRDRLITAAVAGNELVQALESSADYTQSLQEFKKVAMETPELDAILQGSRAAEPTLLEEKLIWSIVGLVNCMQINHDKKYLRAAAAVKEALTNLWGDVVTGIYQRSLKDEWGGASAEAEETTPVIEVGEHSL